MTLKNNRAPLLYYNKLRASFQSHGLIQTTVTVPKPSIRDKIGIILSLWPWNLTDRLENTIGHLFCTTFSFVHHFKAMGEFKLELQSRTLIFGQNLQLLSHVTLKFDRWPWKTIGHLSYAASSFVHHFKSISEVKLELQSRNAQCGSKFVIFLVLHDLEIRWMTLKNNGVPLLCCFKLCASFHSHSWIQTWVTARKCPIWVKIIDFLRRVTVKFDRQPLKIIGHIF